MNNHDLKLLLKEFENGNIDSFTRIYEELKVPVYTIIYRILYDHMMSEDVMQDIFVRLYKAPPPLHIENPRAWIFQMARNLAIDYKRKTKYCEPLSHEVESKDFEVEGIVNTRMDIESALKKLLSEDREIVTLHLNGDMKFREIAQLTNKPLGTVLWRYQRSIKKLREFLSGGE